MSGRRPARPKRRYRRPAQLLAVVGRLDLAACGGFEADYEMQRQYWQYAPAITASFRGNTGDGIRMALDVGADLWHMWHYHGSYGFKHPDPDYPFSIRVKRLPDWTPDIREPEVEMAWIVSSESRSSQWSGDIPGQTGAFFFKLANKATCILIFLFANF